MCDGLTRHLRFILWWLQLRKVVVGKLPTDAGGVHRVPHRC